MMGDVPNVPVAAAVRKPSTAENGTRFAATCLLLYVSGVAGPAAAQVLREPPTAYGPLVYENDYADRELTGISKDLKGIPLDPDGQFTVDFGGSLRERAEFFTSPVLGLGPASVRDDGFLLHRLLLNTDLRVGNHLRGFVQFGNHLEAGRYPDALPTDVSRADLAQGFVEVAIPFEGADLGLRAGRQEMTFGSNRLVDIREGPNIRQSFDGVRGWTEIGELRIDGFWTSPVENRTGAFDDRSTPGQAFYGVYATAPASLTPGLGVDLYFLQLDRLDASLDAGIADDRRSTIGTRWFGNAGSVDYNTEFVYQFGHFGDRRIDAWAFFSDTGYTFADVIGKPRFAVKANVASGGDSRGTGSLSTFYPLFPKNNYFNEANIQTFVNYMDVYPYVQFQPRDDLAIMAGVDFLWRQNVEDGFYEPPGRSIVAGNANDRRALGQAYSAQIEWQASPNLNLNASVVRFETAGFLKEAKAQDTTWFGFWTTFNF